MGKPTNGPDWTDVLLYLTEISDGREQRVSILLECDGYGAGPRWRIYAFTSPRKVALVGESQGAGVVALWPHGDHRTMEGAVFNLLAVLDAELGRAEFLKVMKL